MGPIIVVVVYKFHRNHRTASRVENIILTPLYILYAFTTTAKMVQDYKNIKSVRVG